MCKAAEYWSKELHWGSEMVKVRGSLQSLPYSAILYATVGGYEKMHEIFHDSQVFWWRFKAGIYRIQATSVITWAILLNRLTPNDPYMGRTAPLTSKRCILYIYSINVGTEYFKHALYSPFFSLQNAVCFIMLTFLVPVLFTFYIQGVLKLKK